MAKPVYCTAASATLHPFAARMLITALVLHIGGALYHRFILKDGLLPRHYERHRATGGDGQASRGQVKEAPAASRV